MLQTRVVYKPGELAAFLRDFAEQIERLPGYLAFDSAYLFRYGNADAELGLNLLQTAQTQDGWPTEPATKITLQSSYQSARRL